MSNPAPLENPEDSITVSSPYSDIKLRAFKDLVGDELNNKLDSSMITDREYLQTISYLSAAFDLTRVDSVEFYGRGINAEVFERRIHIGSCLIMYSKNEEFYEQAFDSLRSDHQSMMKNKQFMFKPGGIAFRTEQAMILFCIDGCASGYENILRMDERIRDEVFDSGSFFRLVNGCGIPRMKEMSK